MPVQLGFDSSAGFPTKQGKRSLSTETPYEAREKLELKYKDLVKVNPFLDRSLVSYQANKETPFYRWFKYREGFSAAIVKQIVSCLSPKPGDLLDPFAGSGTALFAAREMGWNTTGIELLPPGVFAIKTRLTSENVNLTSLNRAIEEVLRGKWTKNLKVKNEFPHLRITAGAFPEETEGQLNAYLSYIRKSDFTPAVKTILRFACFCVLEEISFTRKDGQYLRWDHRSGRQLGTRPFDKGSIQPFFAALRSQLQTIRADIQCSGETLFDRPTKRTKNGRKPQLELFEGSSLKMLPEIEKNSVDFIFTSPPYCNRYDYTRTYALELAFLGYGEEQVKTLRQQMLTCTVENREKHDELKEQYQRVGRRKFFEEAMLAFDKQEALQEVLRILLDLREAGELNNPGIYRLVKNYFLEMNLIVRESARLVRQSGFFVMVNDNVQYAGEPVPVDLILSEFARAAGMTPRHVWTLGRGKGNSSQQMGIHGRTELRKSVCVWQK